MRTTDIKAIENFTDIATEITVNSVYSEIKLGKYAFYKDAYGRIYVVVFPLNIGIIVDECGNTQYYEENTKSVVE